VEARHALREVQDHHTCTGVAAARLTDRPRVEDDRLARLEGDLAGRLAQQHPPAPADGHRAMRVAEHEDVGARGGLGQLVEAGARSVGAEHVLARVGHRAVADGHPVALDSEGQAAEQLARVVVEHRAGPPEALAGERGAALVAQPAQRDEVVVARHAGRAEREDAAHALVGVRAVADEVAGAEVAVEALALQEGEGGVESVQVAMDVGEHAEAHQAGPGRGRRRATACHIAPRTNGSGSSRERPDIAWQPRAQRSHASDEMPAARAARRSVSGVHHATGRVGRHPAGRGAPVRSACTRAGMLTPASAAG
jgi:hypothetical protein